MGTIAAPADPAGAAPESSTGQVGGGAPFEFRLIAILTLIHIVAWIDKNIFALMVIPIKQQFDLSDPQIALFIGTAFAAGTILAMLPAGYLADRFQRRLVLLAGTWLWSCAVIGCALAAGYWQLVVARVLVGFGEGLILPACYSLLRDGVRAHHRARGLSTFAMGQMLGGGLALLLGGLLLALLQRIDPLPGFAPFQQTLLLIGFAGLAIGMLVLTFPEPPRASREAIAPGSYASALRHMRSAWAEYLPLAVFFIAMNMLSSGLGAWLPTVMARNWGLTPAQIGTAYGLMMLTLPSIGLWLSGRALDRLAARSGPAPVGFIIVPVAAIAVLAAIVPAAGSVTMMWGALGGLLFVSMMATPIVPFLIGRLAPAATFGRVMALFLIAQGILANATAPSLTAAVADYGLGNGPHALARALSLLNLTYGAVAVIALAALYLRFRRFAPVPRHIPNKEPAE